jgi:DnaJ C terminal domain
MAYDGQQNGDIRATLALSQEEARDGTNRTLNLPGGRQVVVPIPAGTHDGQELRLAGQGEPSASGSRGSLILTIAIAPAENFGTQGFPQEGTDFPTVFSDTPPPPPPPATSSPNYPSIGQVDNFTKYPNYPSQAQGKGSTSANQTQRADPFYPSYTPYNQPSQSPSPPAQQRRRSRGLILLSVILAVLIILGAGGLILFTTVIQPNQLHAQATATTVANVTGTAQANATATAQGQANATATAQGQANATATAQAQSTAQAQATASALQAIYTQATSGTPVLNDPMTQQDANSWEEDTKTGGGGCAFTGGNYHATMPQAGFFASCFGANTNFSNFALQVQMNILKGDRGGLIFRADSAASKFYLLRIDQAGTYDLYLYTNNNGNNAKDILTGSSSAIHTGTNQLNKVTVVARNSTISLYINQRYVSSISDSTYSSGSIAVFAEDHTNATDVVFTGVEVWKL